MNFGKVTRACINVGEGFEVRSINNRACSSFKINALSIREIQESKSVSGKWGQAIKEIEIETGEKIILMPKNYYESLHRWKELILTLDASRRARKYD
jgi:hypothetical protein